MHDDSLSVENNRLRIVITGASEGIGRELALHYAAKGSKLFLMARNGERLFGLVQEIEEAGGEAGYTVCDVAEPQQVEAAFLRAEEYLRTIDIAILNAAVSINNPFTNFNIENYRKVFRVNVDGLVYCLTSIISIMKRQGKGTIAGISSIADSRGFPGAGPYSASKAAVTTLLESARVELATEGIKVITVRPGFVRTNMVKVNDFNMMFMMDASSAAAIIAKGIEKGRPIISFPWQTALSAWLLKLIPQFIYDPVLSYWNRKMRK
jgi:short-subunit dehydrogenase